MSEPYLSIIATSRNDDHGGSMLQRMQAFVEGLCGQAERWGLDAELILVEWNPPSDRPPLAEALTWPKKRGRLSIRIITVPFEAHMALVHGDKMGLYQMIAKNVGARRAKGKFLLFTNVDILFNDELIQNLVRENLAPKILYRIDRTDVRNEIPLGQGIATMLAWAKCHQLRHNRPASTIRVHPDGKPKWEKVIDPRIGPLFGFSECHEEQGIVSYLQPLARFQCYETQPTLVVELEPLVLDITGSLPLDFCDDSGNLLHRILLGGREKHFIPFGLAARSRVHLKVRDGSLPPGARDWLVLRIHAFHLEEKPAATAAPKAVLLGKGWHQIEKEPGKPFFRWAEKECWLAGPAGSVVVLTVAPGPSLQGAPGLLCVHHNEVCLGSFRLESLRKIHFRVPQTKEAWVALRLAFAGPLVPFSADPEKRVMAMRADEVKQVSFGFMTRIGSLLGRFWHELIRPILKRTLFRLPKAEVGALPFPLEKDLDAVLGFPKGDGDKGKTDHWHTNGCGDFTLLSRDDFFQLGGYWEFDGFSMHIDSLLLYEAAAKGMTECVFEEPQAIYHIEHQPGSGFTPEASSVMYERIRRKGLPYIKDQELEQIQNDIHKGVGQKNRSDWGILNHKLNDQEI